MKSDYVLISLMIAAFSVVALGLFSFLPQMFGPVHFCLASFALNGTCPPTNNPLAVGSFHISGLKALSVVSILDLLILVLLIVFSVIVLNRAPEILSVSFISKKYFKKPISLFKEQLRHWFSLHQKRDPRLN